MDLRLARNRDRPGAGPVRRDVAPLTASFGRPGEKTGEITVGVRQAGQADPFLPEDGAVEPAAVCRPQPDGDVAEAVCVENRSPAPDVRP